MLQNVGVAVEARAVEQRPVRRRAGVALALLLHHGRRRLGRPQQQVGQHLPVVADHGGDEGEDGSWEEVEEGGWILRLLFWYGFFMRSVL